MTQIEIVKKLQSLGYKVGKKFIANHTDPQFADVRFSLEDILLFESVRNKKITVATKYANETVYETFVNKGINVNLTSVYFIMPNGNLLTSVDKESINYFRENGVFLRKMEEWLAPVNGICKHKSTLK